MYWKNINYLINTHSCALAFHVPIKNFTMQSMHVGLLVNSSMNTFAGCISSNANRSEI